MAAEFWVRGDRIAARPLSFWERAQAIAVSGRDVKRFGHSGDGSMASAPGYCFESIWHALMGEPLAGYRPAFHALDDLPLASLEERCAASGSMGSGSIVGSGGVDSGGVDSGGMDSGGVGSGSASSGKVASGADLTPRLPLKHSHAAYVGAVDQGQGGSAKEVAGYAHGAAKGEAPDAQRRLASPWAYLTRPSPGMCVT